MIQFLQRISNHTKENLVQNRFLLLKIGCMLIVAFLWVASSTDTIQAATGLKIYNYATKKESTYTGKQIKVTLNKTTIGNTQTPGVLVDGVAVVPYNDIFEQSGINADCIYNKEKGTISISKYGTTIHMTIGNKKATVNGKIVTMTVAPIKLKYMSSNLVKVLVPSRFVSETLGLGYTWYNDKDTVAIEKHTLLLSYNNGKVFEYEGIQGLVTVDGKNVNLTTMPSIIINNTAMLRAKMVFAGSKIGAKYQYNKADKSITLSKDGNVLVMTVGSTVAYLNGKPRMLDTAPIIATNHDTKASYVMVPGSFTASCLGYDYTWNKTKKTSMINSRKADDAATGGSGGSNTDPELGDSGVINETSKMLYQWPGNASLFNKSSEVHEQNIGIIPSKTPGSIYSLSREYGDVKQNSETFAVYGTVPFEKITSSHSDKKITIQVSNTSCVAQAYQMYGVSSNFVNTINTNNSAEDKSTSIELEIRPEHYSYDLRLSENKLILYVTVYLNTITSASLGTSNSGDVLTMTGISPLDVTISEQSNYIYIDLPYTTNSLGDQYSDVFGSKYVKLFYTIGFPDRTQIILGMNEGYEYFFSEDGTNFTISFLTKGLKEAPETPVEIDKSEYEIVIPKPEGITGTMISHEDYYDKNRFVIKLAGDYTTYFNNHSITQNSKVINNVSVSFNRNNETEILIATSRLQGYEIASDNENIYVNIGEPRDIYKNIVVLDPGHGGPANGAQYFGSKEKDINLKILYTIGRNYFDKDTTKLKVYYTRTTDVDMTLSERAAFANKIGADLFVSLHMNASLASNAYGTEVYYSNANNKANSAGLTSKGMATLFVNNITNALGTNNRGSKAENYTVVYRNTVPAILIELGFLSNKSEYAKIMDESFQENTAKTIYETLLQVFTTYPTNR